MTRHRMRARSLRRRNQSGFALALTLALILLTAITMGALFALMSLTIRVTHNSEVAGRESRAADSAVEAAIVQIRHAPDACSRSSQRVLRDKVFDQGTPSTGDDVSVDVDCEPVSASGSSTDQVRIIGADGYQGPVKWSADCATPSARPPTCTPWTRLLGGSPFDLASSKPSLVHTGPESLQFASGVTVRTGAAALGSASGGVGPAKPALSVTGQYAQGSPGIRMASGDPLGPSSCGVLGQADGPALVLDSDGKPECDDANAKAVPADPTESEAESGMRALDVKPVVPATCGTNQLVTFAPGTYDSAMVDSLNKLIDGSLTACRNKTFWFSPGPAGSNGIYSFNGAPLRFADAGSSYVFGAPAGWNPATGGVPGALSADRNAPLCDQGASGSSIVLSARGAIAHTAGRLVICPTFRVSGEAYPALYQNTSANDRLTVAVQGGLPWTRVFACNWVEGCSPTLNIDMDVSASGSAPVKSVRVLMTGTEGNRTQNNFVAARSVRFTVSNAARTGQLCDTGPIKGTPNGQGANTGFTVAYEVVSGGCKAALQALTAAQMNGMLMRASVTIQLENALFQQTLSITDVTSQLNAMAGAVDATKASSPNNKWKSVANVATADGQLAEPVMACGEMVCQVPLATRTHDPLIKDNTQSFEMLIKGGLSFPALAPYLAKGIDPRVESLRLDVDFATAQKSIPDLGWLSLAPRHFRADLSARIELKTPKGTRCVSRNGGVNGGDAGDVQHVSFRIDSIDDLVSGGSCDTAIRNFSELTDPQTEVKLIIDMPCVSNPDPNTSWLCFQEGLQDDHVWAVRPPSIDRIAVSATTDTYMGAPANSQISIDSAASGPGKLFRSFGRAWLPLTDLDIHWQGDGGTSTLFNKDLVVHGLGSDMTSGATTTYVCCGKPENRQVRLRARIEGHSRLVATVRFGDVRVPANGGSPVYSPGALVDVLDWRRGILARD